MNPRTESIRARANEIEQLAEASQTGLTVTELLAHFDIARTTFERSFRILRNERNKRLYIAGYCKPPSRKTGGGSWCAMYRAGSLPDTPWPTPTHEELLAQRRKHSAARKERLAQEAQNAVDGRKPKPEIIPQMDPLIAALFGRAPAGAEAECAAQ